MFNASLKRPMPHQCRANMFTMCARNFCLQLSVLALFPGKHKRNCGSKGGIANSQPIGELMQGNQIFNRNLYGFRMTGVLPSAHRNLICQERGFMNRTVAGFCSLFFLTIALARVPACYAQPQAQNHAPTEVASLDEPAQPSSGGSAGE